MYQDYGQGYPGMYGAGASPAVPQPTNTQASVSDWFANLQAQIPGLENIPTPRVLTEQKPQVHQPFKGVSRSNLFVQCINRDGVEHGLRTDEEARVPQMNILGVETKPHTPDPYHSTRENFDTKSLTDGLMKNASFLKAESRSSSPGLPIQTIQKVKIQSWQRNLMEYGGHDAYLEHDDRYQERRDARRDGRRDDTRDYHPSQRRSPDRQRDRYSNRYDDHRNPRERRSPPRRDRRSPPRRSDNPRSPRRDRSPIRDGRSRQQRSPLRDNARRSRDDRSPQRDNSRNYRGNRSPPREKKQLSQPVTYPLVKFTPSSDVQEAKRDTSRWSRDDQSSTSKSNSGTISRSKTRWSTDDNSERNDVRKPVVQEDKQLSSEYELFMKDISAEKKEPEPKPSFKKPPPLPVFSKPAKSAVKPGVTRQTFESYHDKGDKVTRARENTSYGTIDRRVARPEITRAVLSKSSVGPSNMSKPSSTKPSNTKPPVIDTKNVTMALAMAASKNDKEVPAKFKDPRKPNLGGNIIKFIEDFISSVRKSKKGVSIVSKKYHLPGNCIGLVPPKMSQDVWSVLKKATQGRDETLQDVQRWLALGVIPVIKQIDLFGSGNQEAKDVCRIASDALTVLGFVGHNMSIKRRLIMRSSLNKKYAPLCRTANPITTLLFGDKLARDLIDLKSGNYRPEKAESEDNDDMYASNYKPTSFVGLTEVEKDVDVNVASMINVACANDGDVDDLKEKYKIPSNCNSLIPPKVNPEMWSLLSISGLELDARLQDVQLAIAEATVPLMRLLELVHQKKYDPCEALGMLTDSLALLGNSVFQLSKFRMDLMLKTLPATVHGFANWHYSGADQVSGEKLEEELKDRGYDDSDARTGLLLGIMQSQDPTYGSF